MNRSTQRFLARRRASASGLVAAGSLALVAVSGCGTQNTAGVGASDGAPPGLSNKLIAAVNSTGELVHVTPVDMTEHAPAISKRDAVRAALAQLPTGSKALAVGLVDLTGTLHPAPRLVWMVETNPAGGVHPPAQPAMTRGHGPVANFRVDLVDAQTGEVVDTTGGRSSLLPQLPVIPLPSNH